MRTVSVHESHGIQFTNDAAFYCRILNTMRKLNPSISFREMAESCNLSETNTRRYYYGIHHFNDFPVVHTQMRIGACVPL